MLEVILESIALSGISIVEYTQKALDGGLVQFLLDNVVTLEETNATKVTPSQHFKSTITQGVYGFVMALGLFWSLTFIITAIVLSSIYIHGKKHKSLSRKMGHLSFYINTIKSKYCRSWACVALQFGFAILFITMSFFSSALALAANQELHKLITSTNYSKGILPSLNLALHNIHEYVDHLADQARQDSRHVIKQIVRDIEVMQNDTRHTYGVELSKAIGGFTLSQQGTELIKEFSKVYYAMQYIENIQEEYYQNFSNFDEYTIQFGDCVRYMCGYLEKSGSNMQDCNQILDDLSENRIKLTLENSHDAIPDEARLLMNIMRQANQSPNTMLQEKARAEYKKHIMHEDSYVEAKEVMQVEWNIKVMFDEQWDIMEKEMKGQAKVIKNISNSMVHVGSSIKSYEMPRYAVYVTLILLAIFITIIHTVNVVLYFCLRRKELAKVRCVTKLTAYNMYHVMGVISILTTATFLISGYVQTEVCRYLIETPNETGEEPKFRIDKIINDWLEKHWNTIKSIMRKSSPMPLPKPANIFRGLQVACKHNDSLFSALDALSSLNATEMAKPGLVESFLVKGKTLMIKNLHLTNASDWLRPQTTTELKQFKTLPTLIKIDFPKFYANLKQPITTYNVSNLFTVINKIDSNTDKDAKGSRLYKNSLQCSLKNAKKLSEITIFLENYAGKIVEQLLIIDSVKDLNDIADQMLHSIDILTTFLTNKTKWIEQASKLYDNYIVAETYVIAPKIMSDTVQRVMGVIGPCRPMYEAINSIVSATCVSINHSLHALWFTLGMVLLFLTILCILAPILLRKRKQTLIGDPEVEEQMISDDDLAEETTSEETTNCLPMTNEKYTKT